MKLEQQVCNLELAKRLDELLVNQKSHFYWCRHGKNKYELECGNECEISEWGHSAFTVAELGEMLPFYLKEDSNKGIAFSTEVDGLKIARYSHGWTVMYRHRAVSSETEADARAEMLIYLLENKLINN